jgi:hypothetical protein
MHVNDLFQKKAIVIKVHIIISWADPVAVASVSVIVCVVIHRIHTQVPHSASALAFAPLYGTVTISVEGGWQWLEARPNQGSRRQDVWTRVAAIFTNGHNDLVALVHVKDVY